MSEVIKFLKELQEELKTQDHDCQAAPRFWTIGDYQMVACPDGCEDSYELFIPDTEYNGDCNEFLKQTKEDGFEGLPEAAAEDFNDIMCEVSALDWIKKYYSEDAYLVPVREEHFVHPNTMFLTKHEAKDHLKSNYYHYSPKAHTYAMTAWRAPKVERLLEILETFDWDKA